MVGQRSAASDEQVAQLLARLGLELPTIPKLIPNVVSKSNLSKIKGYSRLHCFNCRTWVRIHPIMVDLSQIPVNDLTESQGNNFSLIDINI